MKGSRMCISTILTLCIILTSFSYAQRSRTDEPERDEMLQVEADAIAAAKQDASCPMWYSMGCIFSLFGVGAANLIVPKPSHERLIGKPMEYVWAYTESYKSTRRSLQTRYALYGCLTSGTLFLIRMGVAISQEDDESCTTSDWSCTGWPSCNEEDWSCSDSESCGSSDGESCGSSSSSCGD